MATAGEIVRRWWWRLATSTRVNLICSIGENWQHFHAYSDDFSKDSVDLNSKTPIVVVSSMMIGGWLSSDVNTQVLFRTIDDHKDWRTSCLHVVDGVRSLCCHTKRRWFHKFQREKMDLYWWPWWCLLAWTLQVQHLLRNHGHCGDDAQKSSRDENESAQRGNAFKVIQTCHRDHSSKHTSHSLHEHHWCQCDRHKYASVLVYSWKMELSPN